MTNQLGFDILNPLSKRFQHTMSRQKQIIQLLTDNLSPYFLRVDNESDNHHVQPGSETHFKVIAVSHHFKGLTRIQRHRLINQLLVEEFNQGLHALSMHLYTEEEWPKYQEKLLASPNCKDGFNR